MRPTEPKKDSTGTSNASAHEPHTNDVLTRALPTWRRLLQRALTEPGVMHEAYTRFHRYSLRNQLLVLQQCANRGIAPGPLATFPQWRSLGRYVVRGQQALTLCVPCRPKHAQSRDDARDDKTAAVVARDEESRLWFVYRARWFVLSQTDGKPYYPVELPAWNENIALQALSINRVPFDELNGNVQGYSQGRAVAINPVAGLPHKTLFHELAHVLLGHTTPGCAVRQHVQELEAESVALLCLEALDLPGIAYARGYIQAWATSDDLNDDVASRIIQAADAILRAGQPDLEGVPPNVVASGVR